MRTCYRTELPPHWLPTASVFAALGDETRQKILLLFEPGDELSIKDIAAQFSLGRTTIVHHLSVLEKAGILAVRRDGRLALYTLCHAPVLYALEKLRLLIDDDLGVAAEAAIPATLNPQETAGPKPEVANAPGEESPALAAPVAAPSAPPQSDVAPLPDAMPLSAATSLPDATPLPTALPLPDASPLSETTPLPDSSPPLNAPSLPQVPDTAQTVPAAEETEKTQPAADRDSFFISTYLL